MSTSQRGHDSANPRRRLVEDGTRSPSEQRPGTTTAHLNPAARFHPNILLPGDPGRAMAIATGGLTEPRMFNHRRGLWGYSGHSHEGTGFLVQATGMGGPSAAIVCEELADLGAELFLRVGTCGAIDPALKLGDLVVVRETICDDGASRALEVGDRIAADSELSELLIETATAIGHATHAAVNATVDLFYDPLADQRYRRLHAAGASSIEMECAAVLAVGARRGVRAACLLVVTDELWGDRRRRMNHEGIEQAGELLGTVGIRAVETLLK
ncbi:MAG: purine-nucleoside phosphorylase [Thermoleophilia bacterium]|nr:purine-nucleoside phosphorylase [Thermoleophilia bacterium]